jgi:hypothetical protein
MIRGSCVAACDMVHMATDREEVATERVKKLIGVFKHGDRRRLA